MEWKDVTEYFSEERRHYKNVYLEKDLVADGKIELSLFSSKTDQYEIYINFGIMFGIVYANADEAEEIYYEIKDEIEKEYIKNKEPSGEFINKFGEKYGICLPPDLYFDTEDLLGF